MITTYHSVPNFGRVLISALADTCLRRYIEKTYQGHGELIVKIQFPVPIFGTFSKTI